MTLGSLFDGIGGWLLAAKHAGVKPIWSSEIEKFPCAVTAHHFPEVKQLGDIAKIDGAEIEPVDIICSGSPCQTFSIAGKHTGLDGVSGIFYEFVRVVKEMQDATNGIYPKFVVWENVPGALSSNNGKDIQAILNVFDDLGYVLDMNILDAQYMGVPQRRRRIFAVWQNVNIIQQMKTDTSFSIITQLLTEILLCILNETLNLSEKGRKDSAWRQRKLSEDGLLKKMKLFGIVEKPKFETLLNDWAEILQKQLQEQGLLVAHLDEKDEPLHEDMTKSELIHQLDEELFGSIDTLWKNLLADLYKKEKLFTTLTETSEITDQTICTCAKILESINWLTIRLPRLSANFYETEQYVLMARKELTEYANERHSSYTLFESMGGIQCWNDYFAMVSDQRQLLIADIRKQSKRKVLPISQGVQRHTSAGREAGKGAAAGTESGTGMASGNCLTPWDVQSNRIQSVNGTAAALYGGAGQGTHNGAIYVPSKAKSLTARADGSPCIDRGPQVIVCYDMTHADEVMRRIEGGKCYTLKARMGTGGNQVPVVHAYSIAGNTIDRKPQNGGNDAGWQKDVSYTLNTMDRHAVATFAESSFGMYEKSDVAAVQKAKGGALGGGSESLVHQGIVRRLTPTELRTYLQEVDINGATEGIKTLYVLWGNYGAKKVCEWCIAIVERIQQAEILQQGVYEKSVSAETSQGDELDDSSLPRPEYIAEWLLRDMRQQQECGCASQRWEPAEQFARKLNASVQKLSFENPSSKGEMCDMREASKGARLLREAFTEIQKIWESFNVESRRQTKTVRRLTPLEAERLQGLPDNYTLIDDKSCSDTARYKALGNGMAQPCANWVIKRIVEAWK